MPENPLTQARFDHVDDTGRLVFASGDERFFVDVDETLERAILEAKQIREESRSAPQRIQLGYATDLADSGAYPGRRGSRAGGGTIPSQRGAGAAFLVRRRGREAVRHRAVPHRAGPGRAVGGPPPTWWARAGAVRHRHGIGDVEGDTPGTRTVEDHRDVRRRGAHRQGGMVLEHARQRGGMPELHGEEAAGNGDRRARRQDRGHALRDAACDAARGFGTLGEDRAHRVGVEHPLPRHCLRLAPKRGCHVRRPRWTCAPSLRHPEEGPSIDIPRTGASGEGRRGHARGAAESKPPRPTPDSGTSASRGSDGARDRIRIRQDVCRTLRPADAACETRVPGRSAVPSWDEILFGSRIVWPAVAVQRDTSILFTEKRDRPSG